METGRWTDPSQPQTLQIAVVLSYINAVLALLALFQADAIAVVGLAQGVAAYAIANDKRWGYRLGVALAVLTAVLTVVNVAGLVHLAGGHAIDLSVVLQLVFSIALVALLVHHESREYQRIWFR
jgi:hypothetical protein